MFSFKLRGAYNKMASLSAEQRARGVITSSAGNHAQGVSLAAAKLVRPGAGVAELQRYGVSGRPGLLCFRGAWRGGSQYGCRADLGLTALGSSGAALNGLSLGTTSVK